MNLWPFRLMQMFIFLTVGSLLAPASAFASFICHEAHSSLNRMAGTLSELRSIEPIAEQEAYHTRHRFSVESLAYLRQASGNPDLSNDQLLKLYTNNYLLLAFRANKAFVTLAVENIFHVTPIEKLHQLASEGLKDLSIEIDAKLIQPAIEKAVSETDRADFSHEELVSIIQISAIDQITDELYRIGTAEAREKINVLRAFQGKIVDELSPSLKSLGTEKRYKTRSCCNGGCSLCPLSVGLKREVKSEGGSLNVHLKEIPGVEPPEELALFQLMRKLKSLLPKMNW